MANVLLPVVCISQFDGDGTITMHNSSHIRVSLALHADHEAAYQADLDGLFNQPRLLHLANTHAWIQGLDDLPDDFAWEYEPEEDWVDTYGVARTDGKGAYMGLKGGAASCLWFIDFVIASGCSLVKVDAAECIANSRVACDWDGTIRGGMGRALTPGIIQARDDTRDRVHALNHRK